jgi:DNA replication and repair protein RecF
MTIFARKLNQDTISIQKSINGPTIVKINKLFCYNSSELAYFLPCQIFYQDLFQIIDAGPSIRRSLLDWGLFYQEPKYLAMWKQYKNVLKQRNALLKQNSTKAYYIPWDEQLIALAENIHTMRISYFIQLESMFNNILEQLTNCKCNIIYYKGWGQKDLNKIIDEQFLADIQRQYTYSGSHNADLIFALDRSSKAKYILSRGQQKIILIALKIAQTLLLQQDCIYLFDDLIYYLNLKDKFFLLLLIKIYN